MESGEGRPWHGEQIGGERNGRKGRLARGRLARAGLSPLDEGGDVREMVANDCRACGIGEEVIRARI